MPWCVRQWPTTADEKAPSPLLDCQTCLLTYNGDWGVLELGPNVPPNPTNAQLTEHVKQLPEAQILGARFKAFCEHLAGGLHVPVYCCCLEICLKTYVEQKQLRLHGHLFLKSDMQRIRCECSMKLCFLEGSPHAKHMLFGRKVGKSNWAWGLLLFGAEARLSVSCWFGSAFS